MERRDIKSIPKYTAGFAALTDDGSGFTQDVNLVTRLLAASRSPLAHKFEAGQAANLEPVKECSTDVLDGKDQAFLSGQHHLPRIFQISCMYVLNKNQTNCCTGNARSMVRYKYPKKYSRGLDTSSTAHFKPPHCQCSYSDFQLAYMLQENLIAFKLCTH